LLVPLGMSSISYARLRALHRVQLLLALGGTVGGHLNLNRQWRAMLLEIMHTAVRD
jgi:hypothetical protein